MCLSLHSHFHLDTVIICLSSPSLVFFFFFFNDTATTEIYTLSLHDALPIYLTPKLSSGFFASDLSGRTKGGLFALDRKSTRLNSSHDQISYAVFCLKKKKKTKYQNYQHKKVQNRKQNTAIHDPRCV